jgi:hypothetical protein
VIVSPVFSLQIFVSWCFISIVNSGEKPMKEY